MSQAMQFETALGYRESGLRKYLRAVLRGAQALSEGLIDWMVSYRQHHQRFNHAPARYSRINRRTWHRYSALIVSREESIK